jgi:hypothetical protein
MPPPNGTRQFEATNQPGWFLDWKKDTYMPDRERDLDAIRGLEDATRTLNTTIQGVADQVTDILRPFRWAKKVIMTAIVIISAGSGIGGIAEGIKLCQQFHWLGF